MPLRVPRDIGLEIWAVVTGEVVMEPCLFVSVLAKQTPRLPHADCPQMRLPEGIVARAPGHVTRLVERPNHRTTPIRLQPEAAPVLPERQRDHAVQHPAVVSAYRLRLRRLPQLFQEQVRPVPTE